MEQIKLELSFFAKLLQTAARNLEFVVVKRKYRNGDSALFPCLKVKGVNNFVYDLNGARFVRLGSHYDSTLTVLKTFVVKTDNGIVMRTKRGHSVTFSETDFRKVYTFQVVNPALD